MFQTEFEFTLPFGYRDDENVVHTDGVMRLATAADEILPLKDSRVQNNQAYLIILILSRVITRLGSLSTIHPKIIEGLYAGDLAFLQEFYNCINRNGKSSVPAACPKCSHGFEVELNAAGGF
jgi:hypothetical protein